MNRSGLMSWDDGFWYKDSRDSTGKAGNSTGIEQEHPKRQGEAQGKCGDRQEDGAMGNLAPPGDREESASHHGYP